MKKGNVSHGSASLPWPTPYSAGKGRIGFTGLQIASFFILESPRKIFNYNQAPPAAGEDGNTEKHKKSRWFLQTSGSFTQRTAARSCTIFRYRGQRDCCRLLAGCSVLVYIRRFIPQNFLQLLRGLRPFYNGITATASARPVDRGAKINGKKRRFGLCTTRSWILLWPLWRTGASDRAGIHDVEGAAPGCGQRGAEGGPGAEIPAGHV